MTDYRNACTVVELWADLQSQYPQLADVELKINPKLRGAILGRCFHGPRESLREAYSFPRRALTMVPVRIELAAYLVDQDVDQALDTLLHETAHALAPAGAKHNAVWKRWCVELGARPERCANREATAHLRAPAHAAGPKWRWTCPDCGTTDTRMKRAASLHKPRLHCRDGDPIVWQQLR
jgi:hypothetical protein